MQSRGTGFDIEGKPRAHAHHGGGGSGGGGGGGDGSTWKRWLLVVILVFAVYTATVAYIFVIGCEANPVSEG